MRRISFFVVVVAFLIVPVQTALAGSLSLADLRRQGVLPALPAQSGLADGHKAKAAAVVGDQRSFWTYDLSVMPPKNVQIPATCRGVGDTVAVYVDDGDWGVVVDDEDISSILVSFDESTPFGPGGISSRNLTMFGESGDIDGNGLLILFLYRIPSYHGNYFDGFFRAEDLMANDPGCENNPSLYCSNEAEMIHVQSINCGTPYMAGVMAHEYQHLIHFGIDADEESWLNEAMSELAMSAAGYEDDGNVGAYVQDHSDALETTGVVNYGAVMLWGSYLYERFGGDFIKTLVEETQNGRDSVDAALASVESGIGYADLFADWAVSVSLAMLEDGTDFALVDVPHEGADEDVEIPTGGEWSGGAVVVPASSFKSYFVTNAVTMNYELTAWFVGDEDVVVRVQEVFDGHWLLVVANPTLTEAPGMLSALWEDTTPVVEFDHGWADSYEWVDIYGSNDSSGPDAGRQEDVDDLPDTGVVSEPSGGDGDCSAGSRGAPPWAFLLLLVAVLLSRFRWARS